MRRLTHLVVLAAFIFSCGGQWYALQCVAWINMIRDYSQVVPLAEAVSMTFSGKYPCAICKALVEKKQQQQNDKIASVEKYAKKYFTPVSDEVEAPLVADLHYPDFRNALLTRAEAPPSPPPRRVLS
jgi:hypothetical protein